MRVLVVDDDGLSRLLIADALREGGYEVVEAGDAAAARPLMPGCDVAVIDMVLPGESGLSLLDEAARDRQATVMVTALGTPDEQLEAMRRGAYDVLAKPVGRDDLIHTVARAAERVRLIRQLEGERDRLSVEVERRAGLIARGKEEWERTFDAIRDPIAVLDGSRRVVRANLAFADRAGLPITAVPGRMCHEVLFGAAEPCPECPVDRAREIGSHAAELRREARTFRASAFSVAAGRGEFVVVYEDVTESRRLGRRLQEAERLAAVGKLAAGVAHEINNPMAFLSANLRSVRDTLAELSARAGALALDEELAARLADASEALAEAGSGAARVTAIVRALKLLADQRPAGRAPVDLGDSLDLVLERARRGAGPQAASVEVAWGGRCAERALADPFGLDQALFEVLKNAFQASQADGRVELRTYTEGERVCADIADEGPGIPDEVRSRVFEPFFTTRPQGNGSGLGLTIAYGTLRQMGGEIRLESTKGKGTRVTIALPTPALDGGA